MSSIFTAWWLTNDAETIFDLNYSRGSFCIIFFTFFPIKCSMRHAISVMTNITDDRRLYVVGHRGNFFLLYVLSYWSVQITRRDHVSSLHAQKFSFSLLTSSSSPRSSHNCIDSHLNHFLVAHNLLYCVRKLS